MGRSSERSQRAARATDISSYDVLPGSRMRQVPEVRVIRADCGVMTLPSRVCVCQLYYVREILTREQYHLSTELFLCWGNLDVETKRFSLFGSVKEHKEPYNTNRTVVCLSVWR